MAGLLPPTWGSVHVATLVPSRVLVEGLIVKKKSHWFAHSVIFGPQNEHTKECFD